MSRVKYLREASVVYVRRVDATLFISACVVSSWWFRYCRIGIAYASLHVVWVMWESVRCIWVVHRLPPAGDLLKPDLCDIEVARVGSIACVRASACASVQRLRHGTLSLHALGGHD